MKREEKITVDIKVKDCSSIRLKQLDTTKLIFRILDNSLAVDLTDKTVKIIFAKPRRNNSCPRMYNCE